jgi:membrane peptidoglycan carboxypeptidase
LLAPVEEWQQTTMGSIPMGHEVGVTALQAVAAFAAIANGGEFVQPYIVSRVTSPAGDIIQQRVPERHRVVSESTAATLKEMLEGVVVTGTGKAAQIGGYRAAGKTGTAQKVDEKTRRYSHTKYVASFVGFAPVSNPEIACIVSIDEPRLGTHHGGDAAAPLFARVVADALHVLGVQPEEDPKAMIAGEYKVYDLPSVVTENNTTAQSAAEPESAPVEAFADASASEEALTQGEVVMPDLTGKSLREAITLCAARGLKVRTSGEGLITSQSPPPGTYVARDVICHVRLSKQITRRESQAVTAKKGKSALIAKPATAVKKKMEGAPRRSSVGQMRNAGARAN